MYILKINLFSFSDFKLVSSDRVSKIKIEKMGLSQKSQIYSRYLQHWNVLWRLLFNPFPVILCGSLLYILFLFLHVSPDHESGLCIKLDGRPDLKEASQCAHHTEYCGNIIRLSKDYLFSFPCSRNTF